jgi:hypothetical protein
MGIAEGRVLFSGYNQVVTALRGKTFLLFPVDPQGFRTERFFFVIRSYFGTLGGFQCCTVLRFDVGQAEKKHFSVVSGQDLTISSIVRKRDRNRGERKRLVQLHACS